MTRKRDRNRAFEGPNTMPNEAKASANAAVTAGNVLIDNCHDYAVSMTLAGTGADMEELPPLPITPTKPPASKKVMFARDNPEHPNSSDIVASLSALINTRSDNIEKMVSANAMKIEGLKKTIDFACAEIKDMKGRVSALEKRVSHEEKSVNDCQQRVSELERYSRWNLRLYGVAETEKEDVRQKVIEFCQGVLPEQRERLADTIDTVRRLGGRMTPSPEE